MTLIDENVPESQVSLLRRFGIASKQVGHGFGRAGMKDGEIIALLHKMKMVTRSSRAIWASMSL